MSDPIDMYYIRDHAIPDGNDKDVKKYILQFESRYHGLSDDDRNDLLIKFNLPGLMGQGIKDNQIVIISLLNNVSRQYPFHITKQAVFEGIYDADCREEYSNHLARGCRASFHNFNHNIMDHYFDKYFHIFNHSKP
jgi:hypothetical protein